MIEANNFGVATGGMSAYGIASRTVRRIVLQQTGTYGQQYRRPLECHLTADIQHGLMRQFESDRTISATGVAQVAAGLLTPKAAPESTVNIAHGWATPRMRFALELVTSTHLGENHIEYVSGYTSENAVSAGGFIDPNMVFYVNSATQNRVSQVHVPGAGGAVPAQMQAYIDSSLFLADSLYGGFATPQITYAMRPEDMIDKIKHADFSKFVAGGMMEDGRNIVTSQGILSKRTNTDPVTYVTEMLGKYAIMAAGQDVSDMEGLANVKNAVRSRYVAQDPFVQYIKQLPECSIGNCFTLGQLAQLDPQIMQKVKVADATYAGVAGMHATGVTADWGSSSGEAVAATWLADSLPAYMAKLGISKVSFVATNNTLDGSIETRVANVRSLYGNIDMTPYILAFQAHLSAELLFSMTYGNSISFSFQVDCDLFGETWITVRWNSATDITFVRPQFADAMFTPIVTTNQQLVVNNANDFQTLYNSLGEVANDPNSGMAVGLGRI